VFYRAAGVRNSPTDSVADGALEGGLPPLAAVAHQPWLGFACAASIQYPGITEKWYAVLTPNSSIPSAASSAPVICNGRRSVSPDAPRVLIESSFMGGSSR
jgi:hypothetical protein